jgi:hypothetical protein
MPEDEKQPESAAAAGDEQPPEPARNPLDLPRPRSKTTLWITLGVIFLSIAGSLIYNWHRWKQWEEAWNKIGPGMEPSGGLYFPTRVALNVPYFHQGDVRWRQEKLGLGESTLGGEGCAVTCAAMVLSSYGVDTDPGRLNEQLKENDGFEKKQWIKWETAAEVTGNVARKAYEDPPSFRLIDEQLRRGNPVIIRVNSKSGGTHFVVIAGKQGYEYLILDPSAKPEKGLYPLSEYGSKVEALRFYERLK